MAVDVRKTSSTYTPAVGLLFALKSLSPTPRIVTTGLVAPSVFFTFMLETWRARSSISSTLSLARSSPVTTLISMPTSRRLCSRFCAVTTTSARVPSAMSAEAAGSGAAIEQAEQDKTDVHAFLRFFSQKSRMAPSDSRTVCEARPRLKCRSKAPLNIGSVLLK